MGEPASHPVVAAFAIAAGLILPVTLFAAFVMSGPPQGRREQEEKTRALEERRRVLETENERLQDEYMERELEGNPCKLCPDRDELRDQEEPS
jgi:hypothetical protein